MSAESRGGLRVPSQRITLLRRLRSWAVGGALAIAASVFGYIAITRPHNGNVFEAHAALAYFWLQTGAPYAPHVGYDALIIAVHTALPHFSLFRAGMLVTAASFGVVTLILFSVFRPLLDPLRTAALVTALIVAAPLMVFTLEARNLYLGYIPTSIYHDPTQLLLKPAALALFLFCVAALGARRASPPEIVGAALLSVGGAAIKPSYAICLLPSLALLVAIRLLRREPFDQWLLLVGVFVPTALTLGVEYLLLRSLPYATALGGDGGFAFEPFAFFARVLDELHKPQLLGLKFLASIAFPAAVAIVYRGRALADSGLQLGWSGFGFGAFFTYLIVERGPYLLDGNFTWSGQVTLFILFVASALFTVRQPRTPGQTVCWAVLLLHVLCGLIWYFFHGANLW